MQALTPLLMFCGSQHGNAEDAIRWYCSLFDDSRVVEINQYGPSDDEPEGTVRSAVFEIGGHRVLAMDSGRDHPFTFTPAISLRIDCSSQEELERVSSDLTEGGSVLMPLGDYGFSKQFCWIEDRFGVSWQLNLA
jgi:predicted 3-demethylubiquinone-9 3-methyltransferase (glyoxalase superfamily)